MTETEHLLSTAENSERLLSAIEDMDRLHRKYVTKRKRWARSIGRPYANDDLTPDPAVFDGADEEAG